MKALTLRLDDETYETLRREAFEGRTTITRLIRTALAARGDAAPAAQPVTVTAEQVREAGRRAIDALLAMWEAREGFSGEESWDIVGRAALGIEVTE